MNRVLRMIPLVSLSLSVGALRATAEDAAVERVGWAILWPRSPEFPEEFLRDIDERVGRLLRASRPGSAEWLPLPGDVLASLSATFHRALESGDVLDLCRQEYDQIIIVTGSRKAERWVLEARAITAWLPSDPRRPRDAVLHSSLLPLAIAQLIRNAHVPLLRVTQLDGTQVKVAAGAAPAGADVFRVRLLGGQSPRTRDRLLEHAFVRLNTGTPGGPTLGGQLIAIQSDSDAIIRALAEQQTVLLTPLRPIPGRVRLRALDGARGVPLPGVEVYASRQHYTTDRESFIDVTRPDGGAVEFSDPDGGLWFVVLVAGAKESSIPLVCAESGNVIDLPITAGRVSRVQTELNYFVKDLNAGLSRSRLCLERGHEAFRQRRFDDAREHYQQARKVCPEIRTTEQRLKSVAESVDRAAASDAEEMKAVDLTRREAITEIKKLLAEIDKLLDLVNRSQELTARVARAEVLARQAETSIDALDIDRAIRHYDEAISLFPPEDQKNRESLMKRRDDLADHWRIRGGERQQDARRCVFEQLPRLDPANFPKTATQIAEHIGCLIENGDFYALLKATHVFKELNDNLFAAARTAGDQGRMKDAEELQAALKALHEMRQRVSSASDELRKVSLENDR